MWENYGKDVNAMFNKLDKLQSNKSENKKVVILGNTTNRKSNIGNENRYGESLAERASNALLDKYGKKE